MCKTLALFLFLGVIMDSEIFEKLSPTKLFFRLAIPSMITMAFGALYQIADGLFVWVRSFLDEQKRIIPARTKALKAFALKRARIISYEVTK